MLPALLATVVGLVVLWPADAPARGSVPITADGVSVERVEVTAAPGADGLAGAVLDEDSALAQAGDPVLVQIPAEHVRAGIEPGDRLKVLYIPQAAVSGSPFVFMDYERSAPIGLLAVCYAVLVIVVARWRGIAALVGLVAGLAVVVLFTLPALLAGRDATGVALVTAAVVMFLVLYLAHGFTARTTTALLGTLIGLACTAVLAGWASSAAHIAGLDAEESLALPSYAPAVDLRGVALCGIVLAGLGVLNDVTITQASAVWELRAANAATSRRQLFARAMRIGRDHIASTVYTIAFAYVGAALPLLLMVSLTDVGLGASLTSGEIAQEVVRTLVGSIGLVLAIPLTTAIAVLVVGGSALTVEPGSGAGPGGESPPEPPPPGSEPDDGSGGRSAAPGPEGPPRARGPEGLTRARGPEGLVGDDARI